MSKLPTTRVAEHVRAASQPEEERRMRASLSFFIFHKLCIRSRLLIASAFSSAKPVGGPSLISVFRTTEQQGSSRKRIDCDWDASRVGAALFLPRGSAESSTIASYTSSLLNLLGSKRSMLLYFNTNFYSSIVYDFQQPVVCHYSLPLHVDTHHWK